MSMEIFNSGSRDFTRQVDHAIANGAYRRGKLFADAVVSNVAVCETILDYGCGPGRISAMLAELGYRVEGYDPSPMMLVEARKLPNKGNRLSFILASGSGEVLPDGRYGAIICSSVIEFVPEPEDILGHFFRALKPGGLLALSFSNRRSLWGAYSRWRGAQPHFALQYNVWTFAQTRKILATAGFTVSRAPVYYEASPFDRRPILRSLSASPLIGTLGFVTARRVGQA